MKKRLIDGLLGVIVGVLLILFLMPKSTGVQDQLKENDKRYKKKIDSLHVIIKDLEKKDILLLNTIKLMRMDRSKMVREKEIYRIKYERLKNTPVLLHYTDEQIDSVLSALYPR